MSPAKNRKSRPTRGTLLTISALLLGSALLRIGVGADQAIALDRVEPPAPIESSVIGEACEPQPDIQQVLDALNGRAGKLDQREAQVTKRMQALAVMEDQINTRLKELVAAEESLRETLALADSAAENDITRLVAVYENMKPKDAAALFEQMDPSFASGFLARMRPEAAAGIMTGLKPETAYTISAILAGRNASVPKE